MEYVLKELKNTISVSKIAFVHFFEFKEDYYTKLDSHPFFELVYVASGSLFIQSDDFTGQLNKDNLILHRPNEKHSLSCKNKDNPTVIIIGFSCNGFGLEKLSNCPISLLPQDIKKLAEIVKEGRNVFAPPYDVPVFDMKKKKNTLFGSEQMLKILLEYFLISVARSFSDLRNEESGESVKFSVNELIQYVNENYKEKITIDELAFLFCTNRSTICKEFKNATGFTLTDYINQIKLKSAKEKMLNSDKTLSTIAFEEGFLSIHYFTRFFKKETGISPNQFRKNK